MRRAAIVLGLLLTMCGAPSTALAPGSASLVPPATPRVALPTPMPQQVTRTSAAAQVAWVNVKPSEGLLVGVDPGGKIVGRLDRALGRFYRSSDGERVVLINDQVTSYSALDGTLQRSYGPTPGGYPVDVAFSADGRWLAFLGSQSYVALVDLQGGKMESKKLPHDPSASHPGLSCSSCGPDTLLWSGLVFSADSRRLYTIVDWGGPLRLTVFDLTNGSDPLAQIASSQGAGSAPPPSCSGPAISSRVVDSGRKIAIFCYFDAQVMFFDATTLASTGVIRAEMRNPFWIAPMFTPDGQLLYLRQYPGFGDQVQVVDLRSQKLLGPVPTPRKTSDPAPFSWSVPVAYAGGTPSTVPISPDGTKLYAAGPDGITVLRIPDLKPIAKLADGSSVDEVWVSGDGKTLYATQQAKALLIIASDGPVKRIDLDVYAFVSPERP